MATATVSTLNTHKIETERVRGGVVAVCSDWACSWRGVYTSYRTDADGNRQALTDQVFPNRQEAVKAFKSFHTGA